MADVATTRRSTTAETAAAFGLKPATIQLYARQGRIPFGATPGGHRRFDLDEVADALERKPLKAVAMPPCPKCACADTSLAYCDGCALRPSSSFTGRYVDDRCQDGDPEHFHRCCRRCGYRWRTDDVINPRVACPQQR